MPFKQFILCTVNVFITILLYIISILHFPSLSACHELFFFINIFNL